MDEQSDRQKNIYNADKLAKRQTDKSTNRQNGKTSRKVVIKTDKLAAKHKDRQTDNITEKYTDRLAKKKNQIERQMNINILFGNTFFQSELFIIYHKFKR